MKKTLEVAAESLRMLRTAFVMLGEAWDDREVMECLNNSAADYPFSKSFDELVIGVCDWAMRAESELNCADAKNRLYKQLTESPLTAGEMDFVLDSMKKMLHEEYAFELGESEYPCIGAD